jgi:hypothetical protein
MSAVGGKADIASASQNVCFGPSASASRHRQKDFARAAPGSYLATLTEKRIAVTPLRLDLTDEPFTTKLAEVFG